MTTVLDNPFWHALTGPQAELGEGEGLARRYRADISVFHALADPRDPQAWRDLAALTGPGAQVLVNSDDVPPLAGWTTAMSLPGAQLVETAAVEDKDDPSAEPLHADDPAVVDEMVALTALTKPGPFLRGTPRLGTYLGIRQQGRLVAMAGQRSHPEGWIEISAVCTHPDARGQGLAARLIAAITADIRRRGDRAMLHAAQTNTGAIDLYLRLGFELRRSTAFRSLRAPEE